MTMNLHVQEPDENEESQDPEFMSVAEVAEIL